MGLNDFLNVLDTQRSLYVTESALTQSQATMATNLVALYKALGGRLGNAVMRGPRKFKVPGSNFNGEIPFQWFH